MDRDRRQLPRVRAAREAKSHRSHMHNGSSEQSVRLRPKPRVVVLRDGLSWTGKVKMIAHAMDLQSPTRGRIHPSADRHPGTAAAAVRAPESGRRRPLPPRAQLVGTRTQGSSSTHAADVMCPPGPAGTCGCCRAACCPPSLCRASWRPRPAFVGAWGVLELDGRRSLRVAAACGLA
jgi:hypothetical protein